MSKGIDLLKLLEPLVRPGGAPSSRPQPPAPIESRSFDAILADAQATAQEPLNPAEASRDASAAPVPDEQGNPAGESSLRPLAGVHLIENATLRHMLGQAPSVESSNQKV